MKISVPVAYKAVVSIGRSEEPREDVFLEVLDFDITEMGHREVPVALDFNVGAGYSIHRQIRHNDGVFLRDMNMPLGGRIARWELEDRLRPPSLMLDAMGYTHGSRENTAVWSWYKTPDKKLAKDPTLVREWFSSNREATVDRVSGIVGRSVIVDDTLWIPTNEPTIGLVSNNLNYSIFQHDISYANRAKSNVGHPLASPVFNVNDMAELELHVRRVGANDVGYVFDPDRFEIVLPEVFRFDAGRHALNWAASELLDVLCSDIRNLPEELLPQWSKLRRCVTEPDLEGWDTVTAKIVEDMLPNLVDVRDRRRLSEIVGLWSDTNISLDIATHYRRPT